jgi:hypothetical protein
MARYCRLKCKYEWCVFPWCETVFIDKFKEAEHKSLIEGNIALLPCCMYVDIERQHGNDSELKKKADELHLRKIDLCDEVFILNVGGYIGKSTLSEIEYATKIGKPIYYLEEEAENKASI